MEQKTKFIIFGLIGACVLFLVLFFSALSGQGKLQREKEDLEKENLSLSSKISTFENALREKQDKLDSLRRELENASSERNDLKQRYDLAVRAKDELAQRIRQLQQTARPAAEEIAAPPASDAYWAGVLKAKSELEVQLSDARNELRSMQIANEQLQREKAGLELDLKSLSREKDDLKRQVEYSQKLVSNVSQEIFREKNDKMQIEGSLKAIRNENEMLIRQIKSLSSHKTDLDAKMQNLQEDKADLERRLSDLQSILTEKASQISELKAQVLANTGSSQSAQENKNDSVELPQITVRPQEPLPPTKGSDRDEGNTGAGKVLAVDLQNNFVVIDLGEDAGAKVGNTFQVNRGDRRIATIEVIKVSRSVSACDIKRQSVTPRIGDTVQ